jgi:threonine dehydrogenase-like Zn-dependent dehydrogenase
VTTCNTKKEDLAAVLLERVGPNGVDIAVEATGAPDAPNIGIRSLRPRGTLVLFSYLWEPTRLEMGSIQLRELNLLGSCRSQDGYKPCLDLLGEGKVNLEVLINLGLPLEKYRQVFDKLIHEKESVFKAVFLPDD